MKRRDFLKASAAGTAGAVATSAGLLSWAPTAKAQTVSMNLNVVKGDVAMIDGTTAYMFSFTTGLTATIPGPGIVCQEGDTVAVTIANTLSTPVVFNVGGTSVRLSVAAGTTSSISFAAPAAGTYLYYDDQNGGVNRIMGLSGYLVVMPSGIKNQSFVGGPTFTRQFCWVLGNVDPVWGSQVKANGDGYVTSITPSSFKPRYFLINGVSFDLTHEPNTSLAGLIGEPALVRLLNAGGMVHSNHFHGNHVKVISIDRTNFATDYKLKDVVSMMPLGSKDVIYPFDVPPDSWPVIDSPQATDPLNQSPQFYPMHCHSEMSQTAGGGLYPHGMHAQMVIGQAVTTESDLTLAVAALP